MYSSGSVRLYLQSATRVTSPPQMTMSGRMLIESVSSRCRRSNNSTRQSRNVQVIPHLDVQLIPHRAGGAWDHWPQLELRSGYGTKEFAGGRRRRGVGALGGGTAAAGDRGELGAGSAHGPQVRHPGARVGIRTWCWAAT